MYTTWINSVSLRLFLYIFVQTIFIELCLSHEQFNNRQFKASKLETYRIGKLKITKRRCVNSDMFCKTADLLTKYGYPVELHTVTTSDGFILAAHRIPHGSHRNVGSTNGTRKPVILAHALLCSSSDWLMNVPEKALGYKLADYGFDVWLLNSRGNSYSNGHEYLSENDYRYWDFSFHEMGKIDVPTWIDYILNVTKQDDLYYVGHSMGSTQFLIAMSENPEYNSKIKTMFALAPAVYITNSKYWLFAKMSPIYGELINMFGSSSFVPETFRIWLNILGYGCASVGSFCDNFFFFVAGYNPKQTNSTQTAVIASHTPDRVSSKTINHFLQIMRSDKFQKYDYGYKNQAIYNENEPPEYDLKKVTAPVVYFHSENDVFATPLDVKKSAKQLPNLRKIYLVKDPLFTHVDFTYAIDGDKLLYNQIIQTMLEDEKHENTNN